MKINKEIQRYQESILFGLSLRQMVFALLAIGVAVGAYFGLKPLIGAAEVGWVCMLAAFPFAMCGFFTYNGMPAERFLLAVIRSEILCPRTLAYDSVGNLLVIHCSGGQNGVVVTGREGFAVAARPDLFAD